MSSEKMHLADAAMSRPSRLGTASVVLGAIGLVMISILPCSYPAMEESAVGHDRDSMRRLGIMIVVTAIPSFCVAPFLGVVGFFLAVAGLLRQNRRLGVSIAGLILNLTTLLAFVFLLYWYMAIWAASMK